MTPILDVKNLCVSYRSGGALVPAVRNASFTLGRERLGIVGESGSGKTTLALAILRLIGSQGKVVFLGRDISRLDETWDEAQARRSSDPGVETWDELIDALTTAGALGVDVYERVRDDLIDRTVDAKLTRLLSLDPTDVTVSEWRSASTLLVMSLHDTMNHTARPDGAEVFSA